MANKSSIKQNVIIAVLAVATLFFAFLSVLACIPASTEVEIREEIVVSSALVDSQSGVYRISAAGVLRNTTGETVTVQRLTIPAEGSDRRLDGVELVAEGIVIPPRATVSVSATATGLEKCDRANNITALYGGEEHYLRNPAELSPTVALIPIAVTAILAFCLVRACKIRYYMAQELRADRAANA